MRASIQHAATKVTSEAYFTFKERPSIQQIKPAKKLGIFWKTTNRQVKGNTVKYLHNL